MPDLGSTFGAAFLGCLMAAILYGITTLQAFIYFQSKDKDGWVFTSGIVVLWVLDTIHLAFTAHAIYFYLVVSFGNYHALEGPVWSLLGIVYVTDISDIIARGYFAKRVFLICDHQRPVLRVFLPGIIGVFSVITFVFGAGFASRVLQFKSFDELNTVSSFLYVSIAASVAADSIIAACLCAMLIRSRTGVPRTDSMITTLIAFSINTGLLASVFALICLVTYPVWPNKFIYIGFYFVLSKLNVNSLLASLNARSSLRERGASCSVDQRMETSEWVFHRGVRRTSALQFALNTQFVVTSIASGANDEAGAPQTRYTEQVTDTHDQSHEHEQGWEASAV